MCGLVGFLFDPGFTGDGAKFKGRTSEFAAQKTESLKVQKVKAELHVRT